MIDCRSLVYSTRGNPLVRSGNARKTCLTGTQDPFLINCEPFASLTQIPHAPTNRPTLPPLLSRPDDGLDHQSLNSLDFAVIVYILCADIDTALLP